MRLLVQAGRPYLLTRKPDILLEEDSKSCERKEKRWVLLSVWTLDGKIYVKTSPEGRPIKINDLEDLETYNQKQKIPKDDTLYVTDGDGNRNRSMRMEHSQNSYGLFVVYRYACVDVISINFSYCCFYPNLPSILLGFTPILIRGHNFI